MLEGKQILSDGTSCHQGQTLLTATIQSSVTAQFFPLRICHLVVVGVVVDSPRRGAAHYKEQAGLDPREFNQA